MSTNNLKSDAECPPTLGGERRFFCPSKNENNEWMCVTLGQLCNTKPDCPEGEDENDTMCLFHRPVSILISNNRVAYNNHSEVVFRGQF